MEKLTFEQLPDAVQALTNEIKELKKLIVEKNGQQNPTNQPAKFLTIEEAAKVLRLSKLTLYGKVSKREIPCMKRGKRLYFSESELIKYLEDGRKLTTAEIKEEASNYLNKKKRR